MRSLSTTPTTALLAGALLLAGAGTAACGNGGQEADAGNAEAEKQATTEEKTAKAGQAETSESSTAKQEGSAQKVAKADAEATSNGGNGKPYTLECPDDGGPCKVDEKTYEGWRAFSGFCERCHGPGGLGSSIGPNLVKRINKKPIDKGRFIQVVASGWDGPMSGKMPAFGQNPNVNDKFNELWAYLKARADGKIGPGRPEKIGAEGPGEGAPANWE